MQTWKTAICLVAIAIGSSPARAQVAEAGVVSVPLIYTGESERESGDPICAHGPNWIVGDASVLSSLRVGGDTTGCDSEYLAYVEFDLTQVDVPTTIRNATLRLSVTASEHDDFNIGLFGYWSFGGGMSVPRWTLVAETSIAQFKALDVISSGTFDVTAHLLTAIATGQPRVGFMLAAMTPMLGEDGIVTFAGISSQSPPELLLDGRTQTPNNKTSWTSLKSRY